MLNSGLRPPHILSNPMYESSNIDVIPRNTGLADDRQKAGHSPLSISSLISPASSKEAHVLFLQPGAQHLMTVHTVLETQS